MNPLREMPRNLLCCAVSNDGRKEEEERKEQWAKLTPDIQHNIIAATKRNNKCSHNQPIITQRVH